MAKKADASITLGDIFPSKLSIHHSLSPSHQLKVLFSKWDDLRKDPNFRQACDEFYKDKTSSLSKFFDEWGTYPMPWFLLAPDTFRRAAEEFAEKAGAIKTIVVYPWTTKNELVRTLTADGFLKPAKRTNFEDLWEKTFLLFLHIYGYTARDMAEAIGEKTSRGRRKKYSDELSEGEHDRADKILKSLLAKGVKWNTGDRTAPDLKAIRVVKKARYKEASIIPILRMEYNRALKDLEKFSTLIKSHSRPHPSKSL